MSLLDKSSLVVTPNAYKASKLYSVIPSDGTGDMTVVRATTATRVNSLGLIESVAVNVPRVDYTNGSCPSLLVEPQRTNLVFPSATLTTQTRTVTAAPNTLSFYGTGTIVLSGVHIATLTGTGANNRVSLTFTPTAGSLILTVTGTVTNAQLELGSYATSYIPTVASTLTRNADVISKTGISSLIGQTEGTLFVDIVYIDVTTTNAIGINNGTPLDRVVVFSGSGLLFAQVRVGNVNQFSVNIPVLVGTRYKAAIAYKGSDFAFYVNGNQIAVGSTGTVPTCSVFSYDAGSGGNPFLGKNNSSQLYKTRLTNTELQSLTTL